MVLVVVIETKVFTTLFIHIGIYIFLEGVFVVFLAIMISQQKIGGFLAHFPLIAYRVF